MTIQLLWLAQLHHALPPMGLTHYCPQLFEVPLLPHKSHPSQLSVHFSCLETCKGRTITVQCDRSNLLLAAKRIQTVSWQHDTLRFSSQADVHPCSLGSNMEVCELKLCSFRPLKNVSAFWCYCCMYAIGVAIRGLGMGWLDMDTSLIYPVHDVQKKVFPPPVLILHMLSSFCSCLCDNVREECFFNKAAKTKMPRPE